MLNFFIMFEIDDLDLDIDYVFGTPPARPATSTSLCFEKGLFENAGGQHNIPDGDQTSNLTTPTFSNFTIRKAGAVHSRQRRFPGPAGLLPDTPPRTLKDLGPDTSLHGDENSDTSNSILYSQSSVSVFSEPPYKKMLSDLHMTDNKSPLCKYTIDWVKKKVLSKKLNGQKVPFLGIILHSLDCSTPDPILVLRDPTGELYGTLHREVWQEMSTKLHPGAALVLKQVGVLTTGLSRRQVHLNITLNNIVTIYSSTNMPQEVDTNIIHPMTSTELCRSIQEWQTHSISANQQTVSPDLSSSLFQSISNEKRQNNSSWMPHNTDKTGTNSSECNFDLSFSFDNIEVLLEDRGKQRDKENARKIANPSKEATNSISRKRKQLDADLTSTTSWSPNFEKQPPQGYSTPNSSKTGTFTPKVWRAGSQTPVLITNSQLTQAECELLQDTLSGIDMTEFD